MIDKNVHAFGVAAQNRENWEYHAANLIAWAAAVVLYSLPVIALCCILGAFGTGECRDIATWFATLDIAILAAVPVSCLIIRAVFRKEATEYAATV